MSYYLCLSVPKAASEVLRGAFDEKVWFTDADATPIGRATCGRISECRPVLLQTGIGSASLVGKAAARRTHNNDHTGLFVSGLDRLLNSGKCDQLAFLLHWFSGYITTEEVRVTDVRTVAESKLLATVLTTEEDVRYVVSAIVAEAWWRR